LQFLTIKKHCRERKDGKQSAQAFVVRKNRKFGDVLSQIGIKTREPVLITGAHASGKSYWLERLHKDAHRVWATKSAATPIFLSSLWSLADWTMGKHLEMWWAMRDDDDEDRHWRKLSAGEKQRALPEYLRETKAVLFVDDAHALSGKKLKICQECIRASTVWIVSASDEGRISPGLRKDLLFKNPQIFRLDSEVAYDATNILMWIAMLVAGGFGAYEIAMALGGLKMLSGGNRATKQN